MKDERGLYYHARAGNPDVRVYVRESEDGEVQFRLWVAGQPQFWEGHPWLPLEVIRQAAQLYRDERNPEARWEDVYDEKIARALIEENRG